MCLYSIQASECRDSLGMASGAIPDERITASSIMNHHLQVDLSSIYTRVTRVATQGRNGHGPQRVTKYKLQYGNDGESFQYYRARGQSTDKVEWFEDEIRKEIEQFQFLMEKKLVPE